MEGSKSRLLGRLLGKLRGERLTMDKNFSFCSTGVNETVCCGSSTEDDTEPASTQASSQTHFDHAKFAANLDLRYGGQYLSPEQLPEFCNQLHHLVGVIRNIQSYAKVTGEYPIELERRLEREAREVAALASEVRNARDAATRATVQRDALRTEKSALATQLAKMKEVEVRELESTVRVSDRKLYKSYEAVRDTSDPSDFDPILEEIRNKQAALEGLERLIENRKNSISRRATHALPLPAHDEGGLSRKRDVVKRGRASKRRRRERSPRSAPLSSEPSTHEPHQVTLFIQGSNISGSSVSRARPGGAVTLGSLELPSRASVRDILFFTAN